MQSLDLSNALLEQSCFLWLRSISSLSRPLASSKANQLLHKLLAPQLNILIDYSLLFMFFIKNVIKNLFHNLYEIVKGLRLIKDHNASILRKWHVWHLAVKFDLFPYDQGFLVFTSLVFCSKNDSLKLAKVPANKETFFMPSMSHSTIGIIF